MLVKANDLDLVSNAAGFDGLKDRGGVVLPQADHTDEVRVGGEGVLCVLLGAELVAAIGADADDGPLDAGVRVGSCDRAVADVFPGDFLALGRA